jgi:putative ABC transport system permease protein
VASDVIALARVIVLRQLFARPGRTALAVGGIALGVALVLAMQLINHATLATLRDTVDEVAGRAQLQVVAASDAGLPEELLDLVRAAPEVALAVPFVEGTALVADGQGESLAIFGVDLGDDASVRVYRGVSQGAGEVIEDPLTFLAQPDSVVVTRTFAASRGLGLGDHVTVVAPTGSHRLTVRGLLEPAGLARIYGGALAIMDLFGAQRLLAREGRFDRVDVILRQGTDAGTAATEFRRRLPDGTEVVRPAQRGEQVEAMLRAFQTMLTGTSLIGLVVAVFIIYNSLATVVVERRPEIGILRAVGARRREVAVLYLGEALAAGLAGIAVGGVAGLGLARLLVGQVTESAATALALRLVPQTLPLQPAAVLVAAVAGLAAMLFAALLPALGAARMPVIEAIRRYPTPTSASSARRPFLAGVLLGMAALAATLAAGRTHVMALALVGLLCLIASVALLSIPAVLLSARALPRLAGRLFGVSGLLAGESSRRMPARFAVTVAALALGLSTTAGFSILARSFDTSVRGWVRSWARQDLFVRSTLKERGYVMAPLSEAFVAALRTVPGIAAVETFHMIRQHYEGDTIALTASAAEPGLFGKRAWLSENFARRYDKRVGDSVTLQTPHGPRRFVVDRIARSYNSDRGTVSIGMATFRALWGDRRVIDVGVRLVPGTDRAAVRADLLRRFGATHAIEVLDPKTLEAGILESIARAFAFTWAIEAVTLLVALLGVSDTLMAGVLARRREIGILRAIGCRRREVAASFGLEGLCIGGLGAMLGLVAGVVLAGTQVLVVFPDLLGFIVDLHVPPGRLAVIAMTALGVAAAAAAVPARRAARLAVTEALACQ